MKFTSAAVLAAALILLPLSAFAAGTASQPGDAPKAALADAPQAEPPSDTPPAEGSGNDTGSANPFLPGQQTIGLAAGLQIPAFLAPKTNQGVDNLNLGGSFSFGYQYFVASGWAVGGNIAASFNGTIGGSSVFILPLGATVAYWWTKLPLEFTVLAEAGGYMMRYNSHGILDPFAKVGAGTYWRLASSWGVGLQANLWFVPEIHYGANSDLTQFAGFVETSLAAVYHL